MLRDIPVSEMPTFTFPVTFKPPEAVTVRRSLVVPRRTFKALLLPKVILGTLPTPTGVMPAGRIAVPARDTPLVVEMALPTMAKLPPLTVVGPV